MSELEFRQLAGGESCGVGADEQVIGTKAPAVDVERAGPSIGARIGEFHVAGASTQVDGGIVRESQGTERIAESTSRKCAAACAITQDQIRWRGGVGNATNCKVHA